MTGATYESIIEAFSSFGNIENVTLVPGKSFSFVSFSNENIAKLVYNEFSGGQKTLSDSKNPIYMSYISEIPENLQNDGTFESCDLLPEGLEIIPDFISEIEESEIVKNFKWNTGY